VTGQNDAEEAGISDGWQYVLELEGRRLEIGEGELIIGRSRSCNITLRDPTASRHHVMLLVGDGHVVAKDLQSSNGFFVNGQRLDGERQIGDGDCITIGETDLVLRLLPPDPSGIRAAAPTVCGECGDELPSGATFCPACGSRVARSFSTAVVGAENGVSSDDRTAPVISRPVAPPSSPARSRSGSMPLADMELAGTGVSTPRRASSPAFLPPAGFWIRALAALIDGAAIWLASLLISLPFGGPMQELGSLTVAIAAAFLGAVVPIVGWTRWGTTPGKAALRLVVCTTEGEIGLTLPQSLLRWLGYFPSAILLGIGFLMAGLTTSKRALHDLLAGTYVGIDRR